MANKLAAESLGLLAAFPSQVFRDEVLPLLDNPSLENLKLACPSLFVTSEVNAFAEDRCFVQEPQREADKWVSIACPFLFVPSAVNAFAEMMQEDRRYEQELPREANRWVSRQNKKRILESAKYASFGTEPINEEKMAWMFGDARIIMGEGYFASDDEVSLVVTSPPYFNCRAYGPGEEKTNRIGSNSGAATPTSADEIGREKTVEDYVAQLVRVFGKAAENRWLKKQGSLVVVIGDSFDKKTGEQRRTPHLFVNEMKKSGWKLWQEIIWHKPSVPPSGTCKVRFNPCHEFILWFVRQNERPLFNPASVRETGRTPAGQLMPPVGGKKYSDKTRKIVSDGKRCGQDVWTICPSRNRSAHVAPFPEEIPRRFIAACTIAGETVLDPFAGTGTTGRMAVRMQRKALLVDLYDWNERNPKKRAREE